MPEKNSYYLIIFENKIKKEKFRAVCKSTGVSMQLMFRKLVNDTICKNRKIDFVS